VTAGPALAGSVALVTGGAGDIGLAISLRLADAGALTVVADSDADRAEAAVDDIRASGGSADWVHVDLSDPGDCVRMIRAVRSDFGEMTTLVTSAAAVSKRGRIDELPEEMWDRMVAVNLSAVYWCCREAVAGMIEVEGGTIINIASIAGIRGIPGSPAYAATKGGVVALSRALAIDHARDGIRVYAVCPPAVETRMYRRMHADEPDPDAARRAFETEQGAGRLVTTDEVAAQVCFLAERRGPVFSPEPFVW
jgi:NAD(P)-dependent dehydrogenase (short-subunit alcohol dehydrogenase family)